MMGCIACDVGGPRLIATPSKSIVWTARVEEFGTLFAETKRVRPAKMLSSSSESSFLIFQRVSGSFPDREGSD